MILLPGETAELLWQELSDDEGTYQAHDIVFDNQGRKGSTESGVTKQCYPLTRDFPFLRRTNIHYLVKLISVLIEPYDRLLIMSCEVIVVSNVIMISATLIFMHMWNNRYFHVVDSCDSQGSSRLWCPLHDVF